LREQHLLRRGSLFNEHTPILTRHCPFHTRTGYGKTRSTHMG